MGPHLALALLAVVVALGACRAASEPDAGGPQEIAGNERLDWNQRASTLAELQNIRFAVYVDDRRSELTDASCGTTADTAGYRCSAALPPLSAGAHTLQLAAFVVKDGAVLESSRSAPLPVVVVSGAVARGTAIRIGGAAGVPTAPPGGGSGGVMTATVGTTRLRVEELPGDLDRLVAVAFTVDGSVFVAERTGTVFVVPRDGAEPQPVLVVDDLAADGEGELLALAIEPRLENTGHLYAVYTASDRTGARVFRIARFRRSGDSFAGGAVILDGVPASRARPGASIDFGPDGKLYAAFDSGDDPRAAGDLASYNGKVLRLNRDGTTPRDQPAASPVHLYPLGSPRGMTWDAASGVLWVAEEGAGGESRLTATVPGDDPGRRRLSTNLPLPVSGRPAGLALYEGDRVPALRGHLLVADRVNGAILRVRIDPHDPTRIASTESLLEDVPGGIEALSVAPDGTIYFCTSRRVMRLVPTGH